MLEILEELVQEQQHRPHSIIPEIMETFNTKLQPRVYHFIFILFQVDRRGFRRLALIDPTLDHSLLYRNAMAAKRRRLQDHHAFPEIVHN